MVGHYRWKRLESVGNIVYLGEGLLGAQAVMVTRRIDGVQLGPSRDVCRIDPMERLRGVFGL